MKRFIFLLIGISLCLSSCAYAIRYDGPYEGRVIDAETGKRIEGVVILGVWYKEQPTVAGAVSSYYDAKETVTDKNGEFRIEGLGLKMFSYVGMMRFMIFKAGYMHLYGPWESLKESDYYKKMVKWEGKKVIIPLRTLTLDERRMSSTFPHHPEAPEEKIKIMMEEIQKERKERGLD
ncbi:MAG: hypothetical protein C4538_08790 [Nitrospiraceae bacterium]|nr:MAG: hypothetical protein C4538_08790 [Nitrospiraceae bacterium]